MDILARLDELRAETNVLAHPFYQRWSAGTLTAGELGRYAAQYRHAVLALARTARQAAEQAPAAVRPALARHAVEEAEHVALWDRFAHAAGAPARGEPALAETAECVSSWTAGETLLEQLAVMYVIEASQPEVARTKLEGLSTHYGYAQDDTATEYFRLHERLDVVHAREARGLMERLLGEGARAEAVAERMVRRARAALRGNWRLLDGVQAVRVAV